jgi:ABC-type glycerol-3-phosphate transport system substrate-binding protein
MKKKVWARFLKRNPGWKLEYTAGLPTDQFASKFSQALQVNQAPDIFYGDTAKGQLRDHLHPLEDLLKDTGTYDDFYGAALKLYDQDGHILGIPSNTFGTKCYVYHEGLLAKAGVDPSVVPTTWDEFAATAEAATIRDGDDYTQDGFVWFNTGDYAAGPERLVTHFAQNGAVEFLDDDPFTGLSGCREPAAIEAFTWLCDTIRVHKIQSPNGPIDKNAPSQVGEGEQAIGYFGPWSIPKLDGAYPGILDQLHAGPPLKQQVEVGLAGSNCWCVNTDSDVLEAALDYLTAYLDDDLYMAYCNVTQDTSGRRSINESPDFWMADYPLVTSGPYADAMEKGQAAGHWHVGYDEITAVYNDLLDKGVHSVSDDASLMNDAADKIDEITSRSKG